VLPIDEQKRGLQLLANAGLKKLNLSGGEPFLIDKGERVGELARYAKETLKLESVTIVTNGSLVTHEWFEAYGRFLDILAVSCDSFDAETNTTIGRTFKNRDHLETLRDVCVWCHEHEVLFKLNTVVNTYNKAENMSEGVRSLGDICRWKIFQVLPITGENAGPGAIREVDKFLITDDEFQAFLQVHRDAGLADVSVFHRDCVRHRLDTNGSTTDLYCTARIPFSSHTHTHSHYFPVCRSWLTKIMRRCKTRT
jgi:radical S-adenosyl methionine domain-containing protein 2